MFPVIDVFAGPGGLNEGFSNVQDDKGDYAFETRASFEMESYACQTLRLRETYRQLIRSGGDLYPYFDYIQGRRDWSSTLAHHDVTNAYNEAKERVHQVELGARSRPVTDTIIGSKLGPEDEREHWALIGGPPCQAYSLAGRARRTGDDTFASDHKHFLYREYLHILAKFRPTIFVMENVKGLLSSKNGDDSMFKTILADLTRLEGGVRYDVRSLVIDAGSSELKPADFIIRAEEYGIPQKRHRVILLGIRSDVSDAIPRSALVPSDGPVTVRSAIQDMPLMKAERSRRKPKINLDWESVQRKALGEARHLRLTADRADKGRGVKAESSYNSWIQEPKLEKPVQHNPRPHMISDLVRYRVMAELAGRLGKSPKYIDLPRELYPEHRNAGANSAPFTDRFRVQVWDAPSTTIVSHISKDGHYYIHPDAKQTRSLTVREAARLQSFPDSYYFEGPRTQQFHQVGNAVPPLLAKQIGELVAGMLDGLRTEGMEPLGVSGSDQVQQAG